MSVAQLWGTGLAPAGTGRRITSEGDLRVDSDGNVRVVDIPSAQLIFLRVTSEGDQRVTSEGDRRITVDGLLGPQYLKTGPVTSDGGVPFTFSYESNPWQPPGEDGHVQGGEHAFSWVFLTLSWSMSATVRVTPFVDGDQTAVVLPDGSTIAIVPTTCVLPQQGGNLNRVSQIFAMPIVRRKVTAAGVEVARWFLRGERLQLLIESTGALGVGELMVEGVEVESEPVRKATYATVSAP